MATVYIDHPDNLEAALGKFKNLCRKEGIMDSYKDRQSFMSKPARLELKRRRAAKRMTRRAKKV